MDVERVLDRSDYIIMLNSGLVWPWDLTHFVIRKNCYCGAVINEQGHLGHFIVDLCFGHNILILVNAPYFWCSVCRTCIYDHCLPEECEICGAMEI
jgi:hypothetical protein